MSADVLNDEEIAQLEDRERAITALYMKVRGIYRAQDMLVARLSHASQAESDYIDGRLSRLERRAARIIDRIDALEETAPVFSVPSDDQVKAIRNAVEKLSVLNVRATVAAAIFEDVVKILEMTVGNDALAN